MSKLSILKLRLCSMTINLIDIARGQRKTARYLAIIVVTAVAGSGARVETDPGGYAYMLAFVQRGDGGRFST